MRTVNSFEQIAFSLFLLILAAFFVGCVPIQKPPQLTFTPGASFVVTDNTIDAGVFHVHYPEGWRVISGQASTPISVIFAAPDDSELIMLTVGAIASPPTLNTGVEMQDETRIIPLGDTTITAYGTAPSANWDSFIQTFESVLATLES